MPAKVVIISTPNPAQDQIAAAFVKGRQHGKTKLTDLMTKELERSNQPQKKRYTR